MNKHFSKETGNPGEQKGYTDSPQSGGDDVAEQSISPQQQKICRIQAISTQLPAHGWVTMIRRAQLEKILQLSRSAIYARLDKNSKAFDPSFPIPVRYSGGRSVFWIAAEVDAWLDAQIRRTRGSSEGGRSHKAGGAA